MMGMLPRMRLLIWSEAGGLNTWWIPDNSYNMLVTYGIIM